MAQYLAGKLAAGEDRSLLHELNAWRELGEEMGRIVSLMTPADKEDYLPDWFGPRLFDLQVQAKSGLDARLANLPTEVVCTHGHTTKVIGCVSCELLWKHSDLKE